MKTATSKNAVNEILNSFDFKAVQEQMRDKGFHVGYDVDEGEVPSEDMIKEVAEYTVKQLLDSQDQAVYIQDFLAVKSGDQIHLFYPTIKSSTKTN